MEEDFQGNRLDLDSETCIGMVPDNLGVERLGKVPPAMSRVFAPRLITSASGVTESSFKADALLQLWIPQLKFGLSMTCFSTFQKHSLACTWRCS